jgi:hypothetical protein
MGMNPRLLRPLASRNNPLRIGLVAYWPLDEIATSGDVTAVDQTGRGNDLTSNNSVLSTTGKVNNGRLFDAASTEYLGRASNSDLQFGDSNWSLQLWFFGTRADPAPGSAFEHVIGKDESGGREIGLRPAYGPSRYRIEIDVFHTDGTFTSVNQPSTGAYANFANLWWHCVLTHDSGTVRLWMNNSNVTTSTRAAGKSFAATGTQFNVGRRSFGGFLEYFNGTIDEVAKWNRALSSTEIASLYNSGNGLSLK